MSKCDCFHSGECWGTKEREECFCNGNIAKCTHYPENRKKAPQNVCETTSKELSIFDVSDTELGLFFKFTEILCDYENKGIIFFTKEFDADVEIPQLFKRIYKDWAESDGSMEFADFCDDYLLFEDVRFGNVECRNCKSHISLSDAFQRSGGEWSVLCNECGQYVSVNVPDLLLVNGTSVTLKNGYQGVVIGSNISEINVMKDFAYKVVPQLYAEAENREIYAAWAKIDEIVKIG
jgi:hypothetical protein